MDTAGMDQIYNQCETEKFSYIAKKEDALIARLKKNEPGSKGKKREYWDRHKPEFDKIYGDGGSWKYGPNVGYFFR